MYIWNEYFEQKKNSKETFRHQGNGLVKILDKKKGCNGVQMLV
jgi:hypothetical protein